MITVVIAPSGSASAIRRPSTNLAARLRREAVHRPDAAAIRHGGRIVTWRSLAERASGLAGCLGSLGLAPGDRVGVVARNRPEFLELLLASFHGGFPIVPVNARATPLESGQILRDAGVAALVYGPEHAAHAEAMRRDALLIAIERDELAEWTLDAAARHGEGTPEPCAVAGDHPAWIFYTSGTTGEPKGATLTHRNLEAMVMAFLADVRALDERSVVLHAAPLTHGSGLYALPALARGATQVITASRSYDPAEVLRLCGELAVTDIAFLSPTMLNRLVDRQLAEPADLAALRNVVYGGAPMHREDLDRALETLGPVLTQIYGQAEAPVTISRLTRAGHRRALARGGDALLSAGQPYTNVEVAVRDEDDRVRSAGNGEILTRSDAVMAGYWQNPAASEESLRDGWLRTGDIGRIEPDGTIFLLDRSKDVVISGGANIYPREVEEVVLEHPDVVQVAVIGAPDAEWGEHVVAVVVARDGASHESVRDEVTSLCRERLSGYKLPREFDFRDELPTSPYGKVLKRELRDSYWQNRERGI